MTIVNNNNRLERTSRAWQLVQQVTFVCGGEAQVMSVVKNSVSSAAASRKGMSGAFERQSRYRDIPILPSLRVRLFVLVPLGSRNHFQLPTRSYFKGSAEVLAWAKSTVSRTWVSTRDLVPPSGIEGNMIGRLQHCERVNPS